MPAGVGGGKERGGVQMAAESAFHVQSALTAPHHLGRQPKAAVKQVSAMRASNGDLTLLVWNCLPLRCTGG